MTDDEVLEEYGEVPLYFSHYYNFIFVYKSAKLENGDQLVLHLGGNMEKVSAMVVEADNPLTLEEIADDEYAYIKDAGKQVIWNLNGLPNKTNGWKRWQWESTAAGYLTRMMST